MICSPVFFGGRKLKEDKMKIARISDVINFSYLVFGSVGEIG
jgi:hypothetical protein